MKLIDVTGNLQLSGLSTGLRRLRIPGVVGTARYAVRRRVQKRRNGLPESFCTPYSFRPLLNELEQHKSCPLSGLGGGHRSAMSLPLRINRSWLAIVLALAMFLYGAAARASGTFTWETNKNLVSADIEDGRLYPLLEQIAEATGWHVLVEPDAGRVISAKFKNRAPGEALHLLLGDLNFAMVPETNGTSRLYVFHTRMQNATRLVQPVKAAAVASKPKPIPNELIVRLKPGVKIEDIAKLLGAKVIGKIDGLNAYRLQFDGQAATDAASTQLASNGDVASVESNYSVDRPEMAQAVQANVPPISLQLNPPPANGRTIIGLVDTAIQEPLPNGLDSFLLKSISVAGDAQLDPSAPSHGTSMAETMLRTLQSLGNGSSSVQILPVDVYGSNPTTSTFDVAQGVAAAINGGAQIINLSLGSSSDSQVLQDLITQADQKGIEIYAAKGNTPTTAPFYPAADKGVTPVTALNPDGTVTSWANEAPISAVGAMGTVVVPYDGQSFAVQGTSPATAIVSGTAAYLMESGGLSAAQADQKIMQGPTKTTMPNK
jgi:hypothetical protein